MIKPVRYCNVGIVLIKFRMILGATRPLATTVKCTLSELYCSKKPKRKLTLDTNFNREPVVAVASWAFCTPAYLVYAGWCQSTSCATHQNLWSTCRAISINCRGASFFHKLTTVHLKSRARDLRGQNLQDLPINRPLHSIVPDSAWHTWRTPI